MTIQRPALLLLLTAVTIASAAPKTKPAGGPLPPVPAETVEELRSLFDRGDCDALSPRAAALRADHAPNIDVLVFEANCRLQKAKRTEKVFDSVRYEQFRIAQGGAASPEAGARFFRTLVQFDAPARRQALELFSQALDLDPNRADLVVGNVAALATGGDMDQALALLRARKDKVTAEAQDDVGRLVQDFLGQGDREQALRLANAMTEDFPGSPAAHKALAACALDRRDVDAAIKELLPLANAAAPNQDLVRSLTPLLLFSRRWADAVTVVGPVVGEGQDFLFWMALARMRIAAPSSAALFQELAAREGRSAKPSGELVKIAQHYERVVTDPRRPTVAMRLRAADRFAQSGFPLASVAELDDALDQAPHAVDVWKKLGDLYRRAGMSSLALGAFDQALAAAAAAPAGESAYSPGELQAERGRVLFGLERYKEAAEAFAQARAGGHAAPFEEGMAVLLQGDKTAAAKLFEEAVQGGGESAAAAQSKLEELKSSRP